MMLETVYSIVEVLDIVMDPVFAGALGALGHDLYKGLSKKIRAMPCPNAKGRTHLKSKEEACYEPRSKR